MKNNKKAAVTAGALVAALAIGGSFAYLQDHSDKVTNRFSPNEIEVDLAETTGSEYDIVPGTEQAKDPKVTVETSVPAYVFLEVEDETEGVIDYAIANGWTPLAGHDGVYYREVAASDDAQEFAVLEGNKVSYSDSLTNDDMPDDKVDLSFSAFAIQKADFADAAAAYDQLPASATDADSMQQAFQDGKDILVQDDIPDANAISVPAGQSLNLDMNGHEVTFASTTGSTGTRTQALQLLKGSTNNISNGTITGDPNNADLKMMIQNYSDLTLEDVTIDAKDIPSVLYGLSTNYGTTVIKGNTNISVPEGQVALDVMDWVNSAYGDEGTKVVIEDSMTGTIDGKIDVYQHPANSNPDTKAELIIKGGTFKNTGLTLEQFKEYVADGYHVTENADGSWTVSK